MLFYDGDSNDEIQAFENEDGEEGSGEEEEEEDDENYESSSSNPSDNIP